MWELVLEARCRLADADFAWRFWTDVDTWAVVDPAIEHVRVDPAFEAGARGTTVTADGARVDWRIGELAASRRARIDVPAPGCTLHVFWAFHAQQAGGCRMTQTMRLSGERAAEYEATVAASMERSAPDGLSRLAAAMDEAYAGAADR